MTDSDEDIRQLFPSVVPLNAPPDTFTHITRTALKRRRRHRMSSMASVASAAAAVVALGFVARAAWPADATSPASSAPPCTASDLQFALGQPIAGPTTIGRYISMTNKGPAKCAVSGYPLVRLLSAVDGGSLAIAREGHTRLWQDPGSRTITLNRGSAAVFGVEWTPGAATCSNSDQAISALEAGLPAQPSAPALTLPDPGCLQGGLAVTAFANDDAKGGMALPPAR